VKPLLLVMATADGVMRPSLSAGRASWPRAAHCPGVVDVSRTRVVGDVVTAGARGSVRIAA
jgi:hypothetical protein